MRNNVKGLSGLANLGNTCYINTCMQILSHTTILNTILNNIDPEHLSTNKPFDRLLLTEWDSLRQLLWKKNCVVSPNRWINIIQQVSKQQDLELFSGFLQNDVTEFLLFILNGFHNALSKEVDMSIHGESKTNIDILAKHCYQSYSDFFKSNYSDIIKHFYGMEVSIIRDLNNHTLSQSYTPFSMISLPLIPKRQLHLDDLFRHYHQEEVLDEDNLWVNEENEKIEIKKMIRVWNFPNILIIFLKRWNPVNNRKDQRIIQFPLTNLNLSNYVIGYAPETYIYDLYGVCNHSGGNDGGHYSAYVRHSINNQWYHFNDTNVRQINPENIITNQAYCLFYNKKNIQ